MLKSSAPGGNGVDGIGTGFPTLDEVLGGGLIAGDNVVWICDVESTYTKLARALLAEAVAARRHAIHVATSRASRPASLPAGVELLDASARSTFGRPAPLADELERRVQDVPLAHVVVDDLAVLAGRWGADEALAFFSRTCPTMLQLGAIAYWNAPRRLGPPFLEAVRQVTQCVLEVRGDQLHVHKAESRPAATQGLVHQFRVVGDDVVVTPNTAGGRLARGLASLRRELGLTQAELAAAGGVTASAVSQAESGARGLSVETLIAMSEALGVPLDRFVGAPRGPGYQLTRFDRARCGAGGAVTLAGDAAVGLRAYRVPLAAGRRGTPPVPHQGVELVIVHRGLVQVDVGGDRPVLRAGDSLLASTDPITGWRNLRPEPAVLSWIVRD